MNRKIEEFIKDKILELIKAGISVNISNTKLVEKTSGFFDEVDKKVGVAIKKPQNIWVPVFIHEYCHFCQWKEGAEIWKQCEEIYKKADLWEWEENKIEIPKKSLNKSIRTTQKLEWDCDQRAVNLIKEYELPIDIKKYIQTSNAYVLFYEIFKEKRRWYEKAPYENREIVNLMSETFIDPKDFGKLPKLPEDYVRMVEDYCF